MNDNINNEKIKSPSFYRRKKDYLFNHFKKQEPFERTSIGIFGNTDLKAFDDSLNFFLRWGFIDRSKSFLDAGSGDGRIPIFVSSTYNIYSVGIEFEKKYYEQSIKNKNYFSKRQTYQKGMVRFIQGDFSKLETYEKGFVKFDEVGTFFNFNNNVHSLVSLINKYSPSGTNLIFSGFNYKYSFDGLDHLVTFRHHFDDSGCLISIPFKDHPPVDFDYKILYTHLFKKNGGEINESDFFRKTGLKN